MDGTCNKNCIGDSGISRINLIWVRMSCQMGRILGHSHDTWKKIPRWPQSLQTQIRYIGVESSQPSRYPIPACQQLKSVLLHLCPQSWYGSSRTNGQVGFQKKRAAGISPTVKYRRASQYVPLAEAVYTSLSEVPNVLRFDTVVAWVKS